MDKLFVFKLGSTDNFKKGDWFYLGENAVPCKITNTQFVINIKLGIFVQEIDGDNFIRKISSIRDDRIYYNQSIKVVKK